MKNKSGFILSALMLVVTLLAPYSATTPAQQSERTNNQAAARTNSGIQSAGAKPVTGNGTSGQIAKWNGVSGSTDVLTNSVITEDQSGRIGIGTDAPTGKLTINDFDGPPTIWVHHNANSGIGILVHAPGDQGDGVEVEAGRYGVIGTGAFEGVLGVGTGGGIFGKGTGVHGVSQEGLGVLGQTNTGVAVEGFSGINGLAGLFQGDVQVTGNLSASGTKNFKIDHPLDPENKYLYHAAIESSEVLNVYSGNVTLDRNGEATVTMPDWFQAINTDFRYALTSVGAPGPNLYVAEEFAGGHFKIAGGAPGAKVSWQVTGIRQDAFMKRHPMQIEVDKPGSERGHYLQPELYGQPEEKGIEWARNPELMQGMKKLEEKNKQR